MILITAPIRLFVLILALCVARVTLYLAYQSGAVSITARLTAAEDGLTQRLATILNALRG